jgi:hypothetical protein
MRKTYRKKGAGLREWFKTKALPWLKRAGRDIRDYIKNKHLISRGIGYLAGAAAGTLSENPLVGAVASKGAQYATNKLTGGWGKPRGRKSRGGSLGFYHTSSTRTPRITYGNGCKKKRKKRR